MKIKYKRPTVFINGKQLLLARHVMELHLGRHLLSSEIVHHIDENPFNNNINNLQITNRSEHKKIHSNIGAKTRFFPKYFLDDNLILEMYKEKNMIDIAKTFGCSEITIRRVIRKHIPKTTIKKLNHINKRGIIC